MKPRLTCNGIRVGAAEVPAFQLLPGELIGIANPVEYGDQWSELMLTLGGLKPSTAVKIDAKVQVIGPAGYEFPSTVAYGATVGELGATAGVSRADLTDAIADLKLRRFIKLEDTFHSLQATPRLLLLLILAWAQDPEVVVFSSSGLDGSGVNRVVDAVSKRLDRCSAIDVIWAGFANAYQTEHGYSKIVHCKLLIGAR